MINETLILVPPTLPLRQACAMGEMVQTLNINYSFRLHGVKSCACQ